MALAALAVGLSARAAHAAEEPPRKVRIGIMVDGPWVGNETLFAITQREIEVLTSGEFEVEIPPSTYLVGDWTLAAARQSLDRLLADPEVDLVIAWGMLASHAVCRYGPLPKPVVAPVILDPKLQGLPEANGGSGIRNLSYVSLPNTLFSDLEFFRRLVPFERVAVLTNRALLEAVPEFATKRQEEAARAGFEVDYVPVGDRVEEALAAIPDAADAIYAWPLFHLPRTELAKLIEGLIERRLPSFSAIGGGDIALGMLASLGADEFLPRLARRVALNVQRILLGEAPESLPVGFELRDELTLNMATARAIGVSPTWQLMLEATLIEPEATEGLPTRSLASVVEDAVAANLGLAIERRRVASGETAVDAARSRRLPRLDLLGSWLTIDSDRAAASFGSQAERTGSAAVEGTQILYSDAVATGIYVERRRQRARELDLETLELDVALMAATTYVDLLRVRSLVEVQRNNLRLSRSNLELARIRRSVGAANPAEVYRWESRIATDRKSLIEALGDRQVAEIALNRLLHRPLDEPFLMSEVDFEDLELMAGRERFEHYTATEERYRALADFLVETGLQASPEVAAIEAAIEAEERRLAAARRAFWAPELSLAASFSEVLSEGGAGTGTIPAFDLFSLPMADDSDWSVGFRARLPLFTGGERLAERDAAQIGIERRRLERDAVAEGIEQRIRSTLAEAWSTFPGVELAREAARAARQNLELVGDAYARGVLSILDLLDAQNAARNADELATNSLYDFLIDLLEVERAANHFHLSLTEEERQAWLRRLDRHFADRGLSEFERRPPPPGDPR